MKKIFLLIFGMFITLNSWATKFWSNNVYYNVTSSTSPYTVEVTYLAFNVATYSKSIVIPSTVTYGNPKITYNVTGIGNSAFNMCSGLTSVIIPTTVKYIGNQAFYWCVNLTSINIPSSVESIGSYAFSATGLISVSIPSSVTSISKCAFNYCQDLTSISIPSSVTNIPDYFLNECPKLTSVDIPSSVTNIGEYAFYGCKSLTDVKIPLPISSIGYAAFCNCTNVKSISIPSTLTNIAGLSFNGCSGLTSIHSYITTPLNLSGDQFGGIKTSNCILYIPLGTKQLYQAATGWKDFLNMVEFDATGINDLKVTDLKIYPNLSNSIIKIELGDMSSKKYLKIYNLNGNQIFVSNILDNKINVDISQYHPGLYYIQICNENNQIEGIGKFIKY